MRLLKSAIAAALLVTCSAALAATKTVTLSVPGMYCATCPITVRTALSRVAGVSQVATSLARKEAVVTFDDAKTSVDALTRATAGAGYPSSVQQRAP